MISASNVTGLIFCDDKHHNIRHFVNKQRHCLICIICNFNLHLIVTWCCGREITLWGRKKRIKNFWLFDCFWLFVLYHKIHLVHFERTYYSALQSTQKYFYKLGLVFLWFSFLKICVRRRSSLVFQDPNVDSLTCETVWRAVLRVWSPHDDLAAA